MKNNNNNNNNIIIIIIIAAIGAAEYTRRQENVTKYIKKQISLKYKLQREYRQVFWVVEPCSRPYFGCVPAFLRNILPPYSAVNREHIQNDKYLPQTVLENERGARK
jgi:hypothetical protein